MTIAPDAFELTCGGQTALFRTSGSGTANIRLDPIDDHRKGASCLVKVVATPSPTSTRSTRRARPPRRRQPRPVLDRQRAGRRDDGALTGDAGVARRRHRHPLHRGRLLLGCIVRPVLRRRATAVSRCRAPAPTPRRSTRRGAPATATCAVTVLAAGVNDADAADPPDTMAADHLFGFTTVDIAPTIESTTPVGGATDVPGSSSVSVTFSEPVTTSAAAFALECPRGASIPFSLSGSPGSVRITLDPNGSLPAGAECTVAVTGSGISDADAVDPRTSSPTTARSPSRSAATRHRWTSPLDHVDRREQRRRRDGRDPVDDRRRRDGHLHLQPRRRHREHGQRVLLDRRQLAPGRHRLRPRDEVVLCHPDPDDRLGRRGVRGGGHDRGQRRHRGPDRQHALRHVGAVGTTLPRGGVPEAAVGPSGSAEDGLSSTGHGGPVRAGRGRSRGFPGGVVHLVDPLARRRGRTAGEEERELMATRPRRSGCDIEQDRLEGTPVGGASSSVSPTRG